MRLRRILALLTSVTMLHLSVVAGDAACASHGTNGDHGAVSAHAMPMDGHAMPMAGATEHHDAVMATSDAPPCETPVQEHCCDAVVGCGGAGLLAAAEHPFAVTAPRAPRIREALHDAPASFASAPEPPPPKA